MSDENTGVSREAHERVAQERDKFKSQIADYEARLGDAAAALGDFARIDAAYEHFVGKQIPNAYSLAKEAILNPKVKAAETDTLPGALDGWYDHAKSIFGVPAPQAATQPEPEERKPVAPMTQPNPVAPGQPPVGGAPVLVGSAEYEARFGGLSLAEQSAAVARGEAVFSPEVASAQKVL